MGHKLAASMILLVIIGSATAYFILFPSLTPNHTSTPTPLSGSEIACPRDGDLYVWTPIGSRSENFNWRCLRCGHSWQKTYPEDVCRTWRDSFLEPSFIRDYTLLYLKNVLELEVPDPFDTDWTLSKETSNGLVCCEIFVYQTKDVFVTIKYPISLPEEMAYDVRVEVGDVILWKGKLYSRQFITSTLPMDRSWLKPVYDHYGGVGLFDEGIHIVATSMDPLDLSTLHDYWRLLKENETLEASTEDFISIIFSRGDHPTGGYTIQIKSFDWLVTYPTTLLFAVNFTDPGRGVMVTEALTNPLVLVPMGKLSAGRYVVEVHIDRFILTYDESEKPIYTPTQKSIEEVWRVPFKIVDS